MVSSVQKILTNKSITLGTAIGAGMNIYQTVGDYKQSRQEGKGKLSSAVGAIASAIMFEAMGPGMRFGMMALETIPPLVTSIGLKAAQTARSMDRANRNIPFSNATFVDTKQAYTMRQAGMQLAQASKYNLQQALLGNEASMMHRL